MLASIRGKVVERSEFTAVVECNGFGVEVLLTRRAAERCELGTQVFLYTLLQVGDAGIALYGFADDTERRTFKLMILTKGVGGKAAISILQYLSPAEIVAAVEQNDIRLLTSVPGIGKKRPNASVSNFPTAFIKRFYPTDRRISRCACR